MKVLATDPGRIPPELRIDPLPGGGFDVSYRRRPIPYSPPGRSPAALAAVQAMNDQARRADQARQRHGPGGWPD